MRKVYLGLAEWKMSETPLRVETVLGSCIALTLHHPQRRAGGICHCVLPQRIRTSDEPDSPARFVDTTIPHMFEWFAKRGMPPESLEVKLFGGSDSMGSALAVGNRNVEMCQLILAEYGVTIHASQVGGKQGRKIVFFTGTGKVFVRRLGHRPPDFATLLADGVEFA